MTKKFLTDLVKLYFTVSQTNAEEITNAIIETSTDVIRVKRALFYHLELHNATISVRTVGRFDDDIQIKIAIGESFMCLVICLSDSSKTRTLIHKENFIQSINTTDIGL